MRVVTLLLILIAAGLGSPLVAQMRDPVVGGRGGGHSVYGDLQIEGDTANKAIKVDLTLYTESKNIIARDTVSGNGRYRFNNIPNGIYEIAAEVEGREVTRFRVDLTSPLISDLRQDLAFSLRTNNPPASKGATISAADRYERDPVNAAAFAKASSAIDAKRYDEGAELLTKILAADPKDFQAWTELGNVHLLQSKYSEAENEFLRAIDLHPNFFLALLNLGRAEIGQQRYDVAIEVLSRAVKLRADSADANYLLGESYLQMKKGSLAVPYLNEALRLDPKNMAEVHLRLALLYDHAGMKDKAAAEYEAFLKKRPDYKDRKQLEDYISANKKP
jgi:tetratricopeptide (TPR) repeat protein